MNELSIEIEQMIRRLESLINENYIYELKAKDAQIQVLTNRSCRRISCIIHCS